MKKKKLLFVVLLLFAVIGCYFAFHSTLKEDRIVHVLETKPYSYLSDEVKEYIQEVYEETGEVLPTEVNKEENVPYLNPKYIHYLELSEEEKENVDEIPIAYAVDYTVNEVKANLPTSFDLRNYNNRSYITSLKNQGVLDLCWSFTAVEQAESYGMLKFNQNNIFSTRQLDYAASTDGIKDYENENGNRELASGGNFLVSTVLLTNGIGLVSESTMPFSNTMEKKELSEVLNYGNSVYELNSSVKMPTITSSTTTTERNNIVRAAKELIMNNGGAYIGTQAPGYSCSATNTDGKQIIRVDTTCNQDGGHAMQIIGWDDNYSYKYCISGSTHTSYTSCSNPVTGTGAWLVRNSWGNTYSYVYIAYDSLEDDIYIFTDMSSMSNRNWDNNYHNSIEAYRIYYNSSYTHSFTKKINTSEKVQKIKFFAYGKNGNYNISVNSSSANYNNVKTVNVTYPGVVTVDLSDLNVVLNDSTFSVTVASTNNVTLLRNTIAVFTSNVNTTPVIEPSISTINVGTLSSTYTARLYTNTKNVPSNSNISYSFLNSSGGSASSYFSFSNNKVAKNDLNPILTVASNTPTGVYKLKLTYSNTTKEIPIIVGNATYKVIYYPNGGSGSNVTQTVVPFTNFNLNANTFTRTGYQFVRWNTKANGSGTSYNAGQAMNPISQDMSLYAQWNPITYSVQFNANGGTGSMSNQSFTYGTSATLSANKFTRTNYEFVGWNTNANGSGTSYTNGQNVSNLSSTQGAVVKLYAQWRVIQTGDYVINHYDVNYDDNTIDFIEPNTSQNVFKGYITIPSGYTIQVDMKGQSYISTGSTVKIMNGNTTVAQFTNIVRGDASGDGNINSADLLKIVKHLKGTTLTGVYYKAADCNDDSTINSADLLKIVKYLKGTGTIQRKGNSDDE